MESNGRLVQHVQNAYETTANLRRQPDALRFAAGERSGGAAEGKVTEANVYQES